MASYRWLYAHQDRIQAGVDRAAAELAPDVVRIKFTVDEDWMGEPSVFFKVILSEDASREERLRDVGQRVRREIRDQVNPDDLDLHAFFNLRSLAEQEALQDPAWV